MVALKAMAVSLEVAVSWLLATAVDDTATRIVLYAAAGGGLAWFWRNFLRPVAKVLHRMAKAVESLEDLPSWRRQTNHRIRLLEAGLGRVASGNEAILRELGIEDRVRRTFSDPSALERLLADLADDDLGAE